MLRLAVMNDGGLVVCSFLERTLRTYRVVDDVAMPDAVPLATDCSIGVVTLDDGRLAYADGGTIRVVP